ncbi:GPI inositol-deacylase isoform X2 [Choristoneura fumiferana]|uniref:GPI inositol-deacylase isoform X2 n=1 Tax=Choristoneura fumiferana TaxID=7141 RepID=UPI003D159C90
MKFLPFITSSIYQIVSLIFFVAFLLGILNIHFSDRTNYCEMTYMYEYPQFVKISVPENKDFPQYGLYAYSEGRFTERARKMWFDGVPVLYLPGNAGSHMQARSLASVALRMALSHGYEFHFDFFTVNYNEELSGLYGGVLLRQTRFAAACVSRILSLYKMNKYTKSVPTTVILIGHSMGGLIAKRLLAYPSTMNSTNISIALAAPLSAPVVNFDSTIDDYYTLMEADWMKLNSNPEVKNKKMLISFGSGARDLLMPSGLTVSQDCDINVLTTSIPGVWVSSDHVSIVWCKQLVMVINRYLFAIVDPATEQVIPDKKVLMTLAGQYFLTNRSTFLNPNITRPTSTMLADAFWYEDNRRIYQISRPEIDRMTYLMIRLVSFPQNRFVAIESVNLDERDWIFGCNAQYTYNTHRYCKHATSLTELSRWTGAATDFGKRKLATIHLHSLIEKHPDWTHVIVKVPPTREPLTLNIDINDHASRQITVNLPSDFSFGRTIIKHETDANSLYYELILPGFNAIFQAYLLYVEPTSSCKATEYHVSAEVQVPWAENQEYYHYFTHQKRSPMKLRLFKTSPNVTRGLEPSEHVKVVLLLDPQCKYTISISPSWYHLLAQSARTFTPVLAPYVAGAVLLMARSIIMHLNTQGTCLSIHGALRSNALKPYSPLLFVRVTITLLMAIPLLSFAVENASWKNHEIQYFIRSIMVLPAYFTALGLLNVAAAAILGVMVFSSQLAHRMLFRILWRGGTGLAERVASGLQKISKMYEEYLEDYFYKMAAKYASRVCRIFKSKNKMQKKDETPLIAKLNVLDSGDSTVKYSKLESTALETSSLLPIDDKKEESKDVKTDNEIAVVENKPQEENKDENARLHNERNNESPENEQIELVDDFNANLDNINFHMMLFFLWVTVTILNVPALLTWARNFKYSMVLKPDTSYIPGLVLSVCSAWVWQMDRARRNLKHYSYVAGLIFTVAVIILTIGPLSITYVNYGVTFVFAVITLQQMCDTEEMIEDDRPEYDDDLEGSDENGDDPISNDDDNDLNNSDRNIEDDGSGSETERPNDDCDPCNENRIYTMFRNLRDKFSLNDD